jgi:hypothetical protein
MHRAQCCFCQNGPPTEHAYMPPILPTPLTRMQKYLPSLLAMQPPAGPTLPHPSPSRQPGARAWGVPAGGRWGATTAGRDRTTAKQHHGLPVGSSSSMADVELPWLGSMAGGEDDVAGRAPPWHSVSAGEVMFAPRVEVHAYPTRLSVPPSRRSASHYSPVRARWGWHGSHRRGSGAPPLQQSLDPGREGVRHGYPWVPTDQAHGHPQQVGPTY